MKICAEEAHASSSIEWEEKKSRGKESFDFPFSPSISCEELTIKVFLQSLLPQRFYFSFVYYISFSNIPLWIVKRPIAYPIPLLEQKNFSQHFPYCVRVCVECLARFRPSFELTFRFSDLISAQIHIYTAAGPSSTFLLLLFSFCMM